MERIYEIDHFVEELDDRLNRACEPLRGTPVALSGGLDSSILAALIKPEFAISVELPDKHNEIKYATRVAKHLNLRHEIVQLNLDKFDESVGKAVKAIGRPIPHFNVFPLYAMFETLNEMGVKHLVTGDGPDETMMGYARDLIFNHIYGAYNIQAFKHYKPLINKILLSPEEAFANMAGRNAEEILEITEGVSMEELPSIVNTFIMRKDMDDMGDGIAKSFGIEIHRPYQDDPELDRWMLSLPMEAKIKDIEFGKHTLRKVAEKYLPHGVAWRKFKVGGPLLNVNVLKGWTDDENDYGKEKWLEFQGGFLK